MPRRAQQQVTLPVMIVHRGKVFLLSETVRRGLVLQRANGSQTSPLDPPRGTCCILLGSTRVAPKGLQGSPSHSPRRSPG